MQFIVISEQIRYTFYSLIFGLASAGFYDILRIIRMLVGVTPCNIKQIKIFGRLPHRDVNENSRIRKIVRGAGDVLFVQIPDILFALLLAASFCIFLFYFNHGRARWYLIAAVIVGFLVWYHSIGRLTIFLSGYIVFIIKSFTNLILYVIMIPIEAVSKPIVKFAKYTTLKRKNCRELKRISKIVSFR